MNNPALAPLDLDQVVRNISRLPAPSPVIAELLSAIDEENSSPANLTTSIAKHQILVARMLQISNSPFYGMPQRVESISDAITILGMRTVRALAITTAMYGDLARISAPGFELAIFWRHSIAASLAARSLARRLHLKEGSAFVAGLLHDIGSLVLACTFPEHSSAVTSHLRASRCYVHEAEQFVLGIDHAHIGRLLGERWHFPASICDAIANHHHPESAVENPLACVVHLGDALAHALDLAHDPNDAVPPISRHCWAQADLTDRVSQEVFAEIEREFGLFSHTIPVEQ